MALSETQMRAGYGWRAAAPLAGVLAAALLLAGCSSKGAPLEVFPDMDRQPKYKTQASGGFFEDGRASRRPVAGTVAVGHLKEDEGFSTGLNGNMYIGLNPLPLNKDTFARGQERFNIYCAPCHDQTGTGHGVVARRSSWLPTNLNDDRVRQMPDGEIFSVISHGRRSMPAYRFQIPEKDRWAIVAYVRALHRASGGTVEDVPAELRGDLR